MAFLIEKYEGAFPLWLSPTQAMVLPVSEKHVDYAKKISEELQAVGLRVELDDSNESLGKKIRQAKQQKLPYFMVVGDKEIENKKVTLESRDGNSKEMTVNEVANHMLTEVEDKVI